ncbi:MAG TPA: C25 family cysteine peptidase, partial [Bacteroidia bacterium]|nr:C25 family cysteine peptidase [Bacteroidia bacterium]
MKRLYFLCVVSFFISASAFAQVVGNEWINYSQKYLKVKVLYDGIYRIDSTTLSNSLNSIGVALNTIDPRNFQLFHNGQEEYIYMKGDSDGVFNSADFLEFYGQHNDGAKDSVLYTGGNTILNPYYSLYNDTAVYFLTWNSSTTNRRFSVPNDTAFSLYTPSPYFIDEETFIGNSEYFPGVQTSLGITDPAFISSEGFYDLPFDYGSTAARNVYSANAYTGSGTPWATLRMKIGSHSDDFNLSGPDNEVKIEIFNQQLTDTLYNGYQVNNYSYNVPPSSLGPSYTTFNISSINPGNASISSGRTAIAYILLDYAHTFNLEGRTRFFGYLPDDTAQAKSLLTMTSVGGSGIVRVYDFYHHQRIDAVNFGFAQKALVANGNGTKKPFVVVDETSVRQVTTLTPVNASGQFVDFSLQAADSAFVIVTHRSLMGVGIEYKNYRSSAAGGMRNVVLADISELYDQFAYGIGKDPLAIRNFADYMIRNYPTPPRHLLLIGKSIYPDYARGHILP